MTIEYKGIRRKTTDVLADYGQAHYVQNARFKRVGELDRRAGLGKSTMAQQAGPVRFMIGAWSNGPFIVNGTGGTVTGNDNPLPYWTAATMRRAVGAVGQPSAPVINAVDANPVSPQVYIVGNVTFTPDITYDGLSGPLIYDWLCNGWAGGGPPLPDTGVDPTYIPNFGAGQPPGMYSFVLTVSTTVGGFSDGPFPFFFQVT